MKTKKLLTLAYILITINILAQENPFEFVIKGKVIGKDSGNFIFLGPGGRVGDETSIPFNNGTFEYTGTTPFIYTSHIGIDNYDNLHPFVIEPGEISLEVHIDSVNKKYNVISGMYNLDLQNARLIYTKFADPLFEILWSENTPDSIKSKQKEKLNKFTREFTRDNWNNYAGIYFMNIYGKDNNIFSVSDKSDFINNQQNPMLRQSIEFKELISTWRKEKDSINFLNHKAYNFKLPDNKGNIVEFKDIAKNKLTFVEKSGSWCGNLTNTTRSYKPIYEKYHDKGFEIITFVNELKYDRWLDWTEKEDYPWTSVVELESNDSLYENMLFDAYSFPANYLVNEEGIVIAKSLSAEALNEILMQKFEPENYLQYQKEKWVLPESTYILDKEAPINSFKELTDKLKGKPFFVDCWATWCAPCFEEFKYNEELSQFLKSQNVEMVYINYDGNIDDAKWLNTIKKYNLTGYHLRANESFMKDLFEKGYKGLLPNYMIINEEGGIVELNAFRPSQKNELFEQIKTLTKFNNKTDGAT